MTSIDFFKICMAFDPTITVVGQHTAGGKLKRVKFLAMSFHRSRFAGRGNVIVIISPSRQRVNSLHLDTSPGIALASITPMIKRHFRDQSI